MSVCVCVFAFRNTIFQVLELARSGNAKSFRKSFLSFFPLKIFKFCIVFAGAFFGWMFNVSEKTASQARSLETECYGN